MPAASNPVRGPGRPRDPEKVTAIIEAALRLFLRDGFAVVTMEAVATAAAVSKMTLYKNFPHKEALFEEVLRQDAVGLVGELSRVQAAGGTLAESLCALGRALMGHVCRPEIVAAERSLTISLAGNPAFAKRFYDGGPARMVRTVAETLAQANSRNEVHVEDPLDAAADLLALWLGDLPRRMTLGLTRKPSASQIDKRIAQKTAIFLRAYGP